MYLQAASYVVPLLISTMIAVVTAFFSWRRRTASAMVVTVHMLVIAGWSLGYALELASPELANKVFWAKIQYIFIAAVPITWFVFSLYFSNREAWLTRRNCLLLGVVPLITIILMWTTEAHGLVWRTIRLDNSGPFPIIDATYGFWFWVHSLFTYFFLFVGTVILARMLLRSANLYRHQAMLVVASVFVPLLVNSTYIFNIFPIPNLDPTPFALTFSGLVLAWALFGAHFLDIVPVARRMVVEVMGDAMMVLDTQDRIIDINAAALSLLGYSASAAVGQPGAKVLAAWPDLSTSLYEASELQREINLGIGQAQRHFDLRITPLYNRRQALTGRLIVLREITRRVQATEERDRLFNLSVDMMCIAGIDGYFKRINPAFSQTLGFDDEVLLSHPFVEFIHPDDVAVTLAEIEQAASTDSILHVENRFRCLDDRYRWLEWTAVRVNDRFYAVARDVTNRKHTEKVLIQTRDKALEASRLKSELLAKVSHELRTPLGAILGFAEMINLGFYGDVTKEQLEATKEIIESSHYLSSLVDELLDQAQLEAGQLKLRIDYFSPTSLLDLVQSKMQVLATAKGLSLTIDYDAELPPTILGDSDRIQQILVNLIGNAIKFTEQGGVRVHLSRPDAYCWTISVSDTGVGIPLEAQQEIFEPFGQVDGSLTRKYKGTGLGLSIVKQLTQLMGGDISVQSKVGQGSTFTVNLPLSSETQTDE